MRIALAIILGVAAFCVATIGTYLFASRIERANGGCANLLQMCEHPATLGASLGAGLIAIVVVVILSGRSKRTR